MARHTGSEIAAQLRKLADYVERDKPDTTGFACIVTLNEADAIWAGTNASVNRFSMKGVFLDAIAAHETEDA